MAEQTAQKETSGEAQVAGSRGKREAVALSAGRGGIFGVKAGMTQVFSDDGEALAVTVIDLPENVITQIKTKGKEGADSVQVGLLEKKASRAGKAESGHVKKAQAHGFRVYREVRLPDGGKTNGLEVGKTLSIEFLKAGDLVDITAVSKGKGFQGVMKRHNFGGGMASHGASICHRMPGAIGGNRQIGLLPKGKKMAGHMGLERVTIQNVRVVKADAENGILLVHGSVPGPRSGIVTIRKAVKE